MGEYKSPFHMTDRITNLVAAISEQIGRIRVLSHGNLNPHLRKENRIRTIHSSLAIERNSLSLEQVTAIVDDRMWHSLLLGAWNEIFYWLPIEELFRSRQQEYYDALGTSDREADSSAFVELMLEIILDTLKGTTVVGSAEETSNGTMGPSVRKLLDVLGDGALSATQIMGGSGYPTGLRSGKTTWPRR